MRVRNSYGRTFVVYDETQPYEEGQPEKSYRQNLQAAGFDADFIEGVVRTFRKNMQSLYGKAISSHKRIASFEISESFDLTFVFETLECSENILMQVIRKARQARNRLKRKMA